MKNTNILMVLILSIMAILGSCSSVEEETSSAPWLTSTTGSGSITVGSETLSGIYATDCVTSNISTIVSMGLAPSDTLALRWVFVVTSDTSVSDESYTFSDTSCSNVASYIKQESSSVSVGEASGSNYKVTFTDSKLRQMVSSTAAETYWETVYSNAGANIDLTVDEEYSATSSSSRYNLWYVTSSTFQDGSDSSSEYPSSVGSTVYTRQ